LGQMQAPGGGREAAHLRDGHEAAQVPQGEIHGQPINSIDEKININQLSW